MILRPAPLLLVAALSLSGCGTPSSDGHDSAGTIPGATGSAQAPVPRWEPIEECFVQPPSDLDLEFDMDCGYLVVPEFHGRAGGREVELGITRLDSGQGTARAPLVMLGGGPGQTGIQPDLLRIFGPEEIGGILESRDVVFMEQRGTRFTDTWLDCPALNAASWNAHERGLDEVEAEALVLSLLRQCIEGFAAQGVDLEADEKCAAAYDIPTLVDSALALFDGGPVPFSGPDPADTTVTLTVEVTQRDLVEFIYGRQGDLIGVLSLPATLAQLLEMGTEGVAGLLGSMKIAALSASRAAPPSAIALLMHTAVVCSDDPVHSVDEVVVDGTGRYATLFGRGEAEQYVTLCRALAVPELPDDTDVDVTTDVPVLLPSGDLDVATPTFRSQEVAAALPNATPVVFSGRTHVQITAANLCAAEVMTRFVLDPTTRPDTGCTETSPPLGFVLPDGSTGRD